MQELLRNDVGVLRAEQHPQLGLVIHVEITKWSKEAYREAQEVLVDLIDSCRSRGVTKIYAGIPNTDRKNEKFALRFGFEPTEMEFKNEQGEYLLTVWVFNIEEE